SMPIAVRYTQDAFSRSGWLWPVDAKGEPLKATSYMAVGFYVAKYVNKKSDMDLAAKGLGAKEWKDRKSGSAGMPRPISYAVFCLKKKTAVGVLRAPGGRRALERPERHLRHAAGHVVCAPIEWGNRVVVLPPASQERCGALHHGRGFWSGVVHEVVRCVDRRGEAGRDAPRRQHGHPAGRPPGHPGVHRLQGRPDPGDELQHLGGGDGCLHAGGGGGDELRPDPPAQRSRRRPARRTAGVTGGGSRDL